MSRSTIAACVTTAALAVGAAVAAVPAHAAPATAPPPAAAGYAGPEITLIPAQNSVSTPGFPVKPKSKQALVFLDPGIWLASLGSSLRFDVGRTSYARPVTITQIITGPGHEPLARRLPASLLDGWNGLRDMVTITVRDSAGKVAAAEKLTVCPDSFDPARATPDSPDSSPYPQSCGAYDPFPLGEVWGIERGWAIDPAEGNGAAFKLTMGSTYRVTETISPRYVRLLHIPPRNATASVKMTIVPPSGFPVPAKRRAGTLPALPAVPYLKNPPKSVLPDLVPLPAWGMSATRAGGRDWLNFSATVWTGGNGPLDVEAFRSGGSPVMPAYQYFYRNGKVIGRVRAGTMGFDSARVTTTGTSSSSPSTGCSAPARRSWSAARRSASASRRRTRWTCCSRTRVWQVRSSACSASAARRPRCGSARCSRSAGATPTSSSWRGRRSTSPACRTAPTTSR